MLPRKPARSSLPAVDPFEQGVLRYLARRDRTEAQVRTYLGRTGASPVRIRQLLERLRHLGYVDDEAVARRLARARLSRRPMGRARLEAELLALGLARSVTDPVLDELYRERSERDLARLLLGRRPPRGRPNERAREAGRLRRYGFSEDTIQDVLGDDEA
ncbi:MAG: RecX family transcriptional regulator [Nitrospirota bacterium]